MCIFTTVEYMIVTLINNLTMIHGKTDWMIKFEHTS